MHQLTFYETQFLSHFYILILIHIFLSLRRKREKKHHRHHRKKTDQRKDTDDDRNSGRSSLTAQVDIERTNQLKCLRSSLRSSFRNPVPEGRDKKSGKSDRLGFSSPPPPSPFELRVPKTVTFKDDLNSYESLGRWS